MTIQELRNAAGDPTTTTVYVGLYGERRGRLIGIGREYIRVMYGDGRIVTIPPDDVHTVDR
ncbi:MAG: hypothetical protein HQ567_16000 [Candidatus Nealsonbacteria bacterium]|nr:hypothetical protein [Candidatus Nealsonbacteria bacterium]